MGFLDKIKQQATDVASTVAEKTQETAKTGQLQMQLRSLKGEEKDALADFGRQAYGLHRDGGLAERSGELASGAARIGRGDPVSVMSTTGQAAWFRWQ